MRKLSTFTAVVAAGAALAFASASAASVTKTVNVRDDSFSRSSLTIHKGDKVKFAWQDTSDKHNVTVDSGPSDFNSKTKRGNYTYTHTFGKTGTYTLHCTIHPESMIIKVKVKK